MDVSRDKTPILVIEDNADDSFLLTRQLARAHFDDCVTVIGNGQDALDYLLHSESIPLAIFSICVFPECRARSLLEKIREERRLEAVPVIVMTGSVDPRDVAECSRLGVTAYLPKPVTLTTFIKTVAHLFPKVDVPQAN